MSSIDIYSILASKKHNPHYLNRYYKFIWYCKKANVFSEEVYYEKHHICPKSKDLFPEYECFKKNPWNEIKLTLRQHYIAHMLLWKTFRGNQAQAFKLMSIRNNKCNSRLYEQLKSEISKNMSGENNPNSNGELSKEQWLNAGKERRENQSKLMSELNRKLKSKPKEIRTYNCTNCNNVLHKEEFCHKQPKEHYYCNAKCRNQYIATIRPSQKGKSINRKSPAWNKGVPNPNAAENARKGAKRLSEFTKGRKKVIRNGKVTWSYPGDADYPTTSVTEQAGTISES